jgi:undecaprenyl-diphosphatase
MQGLSALPGISRSGFTVSALLLRGYQEEQALKISFMMSVPAIFGVQILLKLGGAFEFDGVTALAGVASATVMGWLTLGALMKLARRLPFWAFALGLGVLSLVAAFLN